MAPAAWNSILRHLRRLGAAGGGDAVGDGMLLRRFAARHDEAAFEALVGRHGPMVWGVCRRLLPHTSDAEDAFQATFLVLVRRARAIRRPETLGPWLHGVASRVAARLRQTIARRRSRERPLVDPPAPGPVSDAGLSELRTLLDEEVSRLPERYRVAFVLCHLEGRSNEEVARRLGCPAGTVSSRLSRARARLRIRLTKRGVGLSGAATAAVAESASAAPVPAALAASTAGLGPAFAAGAAASLTAPTTVTLAEGVLTSMFLTKLKVAAVIVLALGLVGAGGGFFGRRGEARVEAPAPPPRVEKAKAELRAPPADKPVATEVLIQEKKARRDLEIRDLLTRTTRFQGFDDPKTTLQEALDSLATRYDVQFLVDETAFKRVPVRGGEIKEKSPHPWDALKTEIASAPIPPMNTSLATILRVMLGRLPAEAEATFLIRKDGIEITTAAAVRRELGLSDGPLPPLVYEVFEEKSLLDALKVVGDDTEVNVVVDPEAAKQIQAVKISATLRNVPVRVAVQILAAMGGLEVEERGNVLYVISEAKAQKMRGQA